jgi:hypothetical protein
VADRLLFAVDKRAGFQANIAAKANFRIYVRGVVSVKGIPPHRASQEANICL